MKKWIALVCFIVGVLSIASTPTGFGAILLVISHFLFSGLDDEPAKK